jgi:two-component system NtrC family sensor kinase
MPNEKILLLLSSLEASQYYDQAILTPAGYRVISLPNIRTIEGILKLSSPDLFILSDKQNGLSTLDYASDLSRRFPFVPVLLMPDSHSEQLLISCMQAGFSGYVKPPVQPSDLLLSVRTALDRRKNLVDRFRTKVDEDTRSLQDRLIRLESVERVGREMTSFLDLDRVLAAIVDAAVDLTGAEEGNLLLLDEESDELFVRASRNFKEDVVKTFRLPVQDSLAGQVLKTGKPLILDTDSPQKIKTAYLIHHLIYMPILVRERVIGILEVSNRHRGNPFLESHTTLLAALSEFAAIALDNAQLYSRSEAERGRLQTILAGIEDGVIVLDPDGRLILINGAALKAFGIQVEDPTGIRLSELIGHPDLIEIIQEKKTATPMRMEISLEDGRVMNTQISPLPDVGFVVIMQDITRLKELDQIKNDFVNTVSHDLRSPLTAILGYIDLIARVGPVNEQQQEFIHRVRLSVDSITLLINDLLDLGRIEAGFDSRKEIVDFATITHYSIDGLRSRCIEKDQRLGVRLPDDPLHVLGNPIRLRQMVTNLLTNAIQFTAPGGEISVSSRAEAGQVIIEISDTGPGIPTSDQPFIFDKFYRATNVSTEIPGSGLGLAIVKTIVENHQGRIWVNSVPGQGSSFTVVLPSIDNISRQP